MAIHSKNRVMNDLNGIKTLRLPPTIVTKFDNGGLEVCPRCSQKDELSAATFSWGKTVLRSDAKGKTIGAYRKEFSTPLCARCREEI